MDRYKNEAAERFGGTAAYKEFEQRTAGYSEQDFAGSAEGLNEVFRRFAQCKAQGFAPESPHAQEIVRDLKAFITQNFYTCTDEILKGLGAMYTADERFRENIDKHGSGTAEFAADAIKFFTKE